MNNFHNHFQTIQELRMEAEKRITSDINAPEDKNEVYKLAQELQIYQVELEMQNEELQRSSYELETIFRRYADLFDFAPVGLFILDKIGIVKDVNLAGFTMLSQQKREIENKRFQSYIHPAYTDPFYFFLQQLLFTGEKQTIELRMLNKNGTVLYVIIQGQLLKKSKGETQEYLLAVIDISEKKNAAEALLKAHQDLDIKVKRRTRDLEDANEALKVATEEKLKHAKEIYQLNLELLESERKLKELNENKDKFFALVAHDLKSPFFGLMGYSKMLMTKIDSMKKEEIVSCANNIYTYAMNFEKLVDDLLSWSNLQIGHFQFQPEEVNICHIIEETLSIFSVNAADKSIHINSHCHSCPIITADLRMLKSIFRNLLSNAIKFTGNGGRITVTTMDTDGELLVTISDSGKGMSERIKSRLFKIDERATSLGTSNENGNGLGLILTKEFVEKHGGKIWFKSEEGKGTIFYFTLPNK
jgi:PAS domain S-box-containing protein